MLTIGLIGANSQVGSEVCLHLSQMADVRVVPICRTKLASTLLRKCGLICRHGSLAGAEAVSLLAGCDLVADFTLPQGGTVSEIRAAIRNIIVAYTRHAPRKARIVYMSSLMALGMGPQHESLHNHLIPRTIYGATKRYAEGLVFRLGRRAGREVYVLRLGQVHGELQSVSRNLLQKMKDQTTYVPAGMSYAVFTYTIAEALFHIAAGKEEPGRYSLVSSPEWGWKELYEYYAQRKGLKLDIVSMGSTRSVKPVWSRRFFHLLHRFTVAPVISIASRHRELIVSQMLFDFPTVEQRLKAIWGRRNANAEFLQMEELRHRSRYCPYDVFRGVAPGKRLRTLSDSRTSMTTSTRHVQRLLQSIVHDQKVTASRNSGDTENDDKEKAIGTALSR